MEKISSTHDEQGASEELLAWTPRIPLVYIVKGNPHNGGERDTMEKLTMVWMKGRFDEVRELGGQATQ